MAQVNEILKRALERGQKALSEYESKAVVQSAGIPVTNEILVNSAEDAVKAAAKIGYPVVLKGCSPAAMHKTEMGLVKLNLGDKGEVTRAYDEIMGRGNDLDGVLVQEMVKGERELVIGLSRDPQFGPCVMFGIGGIFTEVIKDVSFRVAPLTEMDAEDMIEEIRMKELLDEFRGKPAVDRKTLIKALVGIGNLGITYDEIAEIDINPIIISGNRPVVVDALVVLNNR